MFRTRLTAEKLISNPRRLMLSDDATLMPQQGDGDQAQPCISHMLHVSYSTHSFQGDFKSLIRTRAATCISHQRHTVANPVQAPLPGLRWKQRLFM